MSKEELGSLRKSEHYMKILDESIEKDKPISKWLITDLLSKALDNTVQLYCYIMMKRELVSPDILLSACIDKMTNDRVLHSAGIALRYGANPNAYFKFDVDSDEEVHIIAYAYEKNKNIKDINLFYRLMAMLIMAGSDPSMKVKALSPSGESVRKWIERRGYVDVVDYPEKLFTRSFIDEIATILDIPSKVRKIDIYVAISSRSQKLIDKYSEVESKSRTYALISYSIKLFNSESIKSVLEYGYLPLYWETNDMLINYKRFSDKDLNVGAKEMLKLIDTCIYYGMEIDKYQLHILPDGKIIEGYATPKWKKLCRSSGDPTYELLSISTALDIDTESKDDMCREIEKISIEDPNVLSQIWESRQRIRVSMNTSRTGDDISGTDLSKYACVNVSSLNINPYDLADPDLWYYKDEKKKVWCFESDSFLKVIETGRNIYSGKKIPKIDLISLETKYNTLKLLPQHNKSYGQTVRDLSKPDEINNKKSKRILDLLYKFLLSNNISQERFDLLTQKQLYDLILSVGLRNNSIQNLTRIHSRVTLAWIVNYIARNDPQLEVVFINNLRAMTNKLFI